MGLDCALYPPSHFSSAQTIGAHHPLGCTPPQLPDFAMQSCAAVLFGSCVLRPNEPPRPCAECARLAPKRRHIVRARTDAAEPASPLHLVVLAPPFWGSTALESLLASSPAVATLCGAGCGRGTLGEDVVHLLRLDSRLEEALGLHRDADES